MGLPLLGLLFLSLPAGAVVIWLLPRPQWTRYIALATALFSLVVTLVVVASFDGTQSGFQFIVRLDWMPDLGIHYLIGVDGISVLFLPATALLFVGVILTSWNQLCLSPCPTLILKKVTGWAGGGAARLYYSLLLLLEAAILGVFCALDTILFFLCWELTLAPLFFLVRLWGTGAHRHHAAVKYTLVMLAGGVPLLFGFLLLSFHAGLAFDLPTLLATSLPPDTETLVFLLLLLGFGVKVPLPPLHTWLPLMAMEGPIAATALLTGLKLGAYGLIRFAVPLAPHAAREFHWLLAGLGTTGLVMGAIIALVQTDLRRMLAYAGLSHVGLVVLGIASFNLQGIQGAILQLLHFTIAAGGAFLLVAFLHSRTGTTDSRELGGVAQTMPLLASLFLLLGLAGMGMPGTSGFPGELLILLGAFKTHAGAGLAALFAMIVGAANFLGMYRRVFLGPANQVVVRESIDLRPRELGMALAMALIILAVGFFPGWWLDLIRPAAKIWVERLG
ncbi:NADH dehydrogenase I subunit M [Gammaproteobacteria bacterium]